MSDELAAALADVAARRASAVVDEAARKSLERWSSSVNVEEASARVEMGATSASMLSVLLLMLALKGTN